MKSVRRIEVKKYNNLVDIDGLFTFLKNRDVMVASLDPYLQLKDVLELVVSRSETTILSFDTFVTLIKDIYGVRRYKHKLYRLIFFLTLLENYCNKKIKFLIYNKKILNKLSHLM